MKVIAVIVPIGINGAISMIYQKQHENLCRGVRFFDSSPLEYGGHRQAINAPLTIARVRMRSEPRTFAYVNKRLSPNKTYYCLQSNKSVN